MQSRDANDLEANIKRAFSAHADAVVLLVDHTKIGKHQLYMSAPMSAINYIVTDKDLIKIKVNNMNIIVLKPFIISHKNAVEILLTP